MGAPPSSGPWGDRTAGTWSSAGPAPYTDHKHCMHIVKICNHCISYISKIRENVTSYLIFSIMFHTTAIVILQTTTVFWFLEHHEIRCNYQSIHTR